MFQRAKDRGSEKVILLNSDLAIRGEVAGKKMPLKLVDFKSFGEKINQGDGS